MKALALSVLLLAGCATLPEEEPLADINYHYPFCKAGIGGDYRILVPKDPDILPLLALFSVGGPYDKDHVVCVISGDHSILDLGKGKQS